MSHVLLLVLAPFVALVLWEHFGKTSRPSIYLTRLTVHLVAVAKAVAVLWARISDFISLLQLYELGKTLSRLLLAIAGVFVDPIRAFRRAYWTYVHSCRYPKLVALGSILLFFGFEAVVLWFVILPRCDLSTDDATIHAALFTLTIGIVLPSFITASSFVETSPKFKAVQAAVVATPISTTRRPGTPRPSTRLSPTHVTDAVLAALGSDPLD